MDFLAFLQAFLLGLLEGLTEFIPVSSTGHLLLAEYFLGFRPAGRSFEVLIQLGAILAILAVYAERLLGLVRAAPRDPFARRFIAGILLAFLPAAVVGVLAHGFIKTVLFETPALIAVMLILGGFVLLAVDRWPPAPRLDDPSRFPWAVYTLIGLAQCLAMIPGVSRSGATIVGAMLLGVSKRTAAEFSFYLAMPTMAGAFAYDLYKNHGVLTFNDGALIVTGFLAAFAAAVLVVRWLLDFVARRGYALFAWWRIAIGASALLALQLSG